jgi:rubredoxin
MHILTEMLNTPDSPMSVRTEATYKTLMCLICGFIYDEAAGIPAEGIPPGTRWEDIPLNWTCPECGARKDDFEMIQV